MRGERGNLSDQAYILEIVRRALEAADQPGTPVSALVRQAMRIASLRHDYAAMLSFQFETFDGAATKSVRRNTDIDNKLRTLVGDSEALTIIGERGELWLYNRSMGKDTDRIHAGSIDSIEQTIATAKTAGGDPDAAKYMTQIDAFFYIKGINDLKTQLMPQITGLENIISRVRQSVHDYLVTAESQILSGQTESSLFTRGEAYVLERLQSVSPDALEKYRAAEQRISEGTPEALAQALTSCRRMIKALADSLYPATTEKILGLDGKERELGDDQYINRLMQFAVDRLGKTTHVKLVEETLKGLGNRVIKLNSLSSKGVHNEVSLMEAESCLMWTFFLTADFLRIEDGSLNPLTATMPMPEPI